MEYYLVRFRETHTDMRWDDRENDWCENHHTYERMLLVKALSFDQACRDISSAITVSEGDLNTTRKKVFGFENLTLEY